LMYVTMFNVSVIPSVETAPHSDLRFLHGRRDSNSRHLVLETSALPTELHPYK
jgi:hypothetical protein